MKKNKLDIAKNLLSSGELVIFPTETVFGLGADATNDEAVKSIFKVKKRPRSNPIICHFKSIKQIEKDAKLILKNLGDIHPQDNRALGSFNLGNEFDKIVGFNCFFKLSIYHTRFFDSFLRIQAITML